MGLEKIADMRRTRGMTLEELSERSGVPVSTLKKISAGITKKPGIETIKAIVNALGYTLDDLDKPDEKKSPSCEEPQNEEETAIRLYKMLLASGYIEPGQELTERQFDFLDGLSLMLEAFFNTH